MQDLQEFIESPLKNTVKLFTIIQLCLALRHDSILRFTPIIQILSVLSVDRTLKRMKSFLALIVSICFMASASRHIGELICKDAQTAEALYHYQRINGGFRA